MQYTKVLSLKSYRRIIASVYANLFLIISVLFFVAGLCCAVFSFKGHILAAEWAEEYITDFIAFRNNNGYFKIFLDSFFSSMLFMVLCFICGTSMMGVLLAPACLGIKGFLTGTVAAYLYSAYALKGIAFHTVIILPSAVLLVIALIMASVEASRFSVVLLKLTLPRTIPANLLVDFKRLTARFLFFILLVVFSALIDALITYNFLSKLGL